MWRYFLAGFLFFIGALEILIALNKRVRDEILRNSLVPIQVSPLFLGLAGLSAFAIAAWLLFYF
jgi:hypothetical protein